MIKWVLVLHLFNMDTPLQSEQVSLDIQGRKKCYMTCQQLQEDSLYSSKPIVHCSCKRANEFYSNMASSKVANAQYPTSGY